MSNNLLPSKIPIWKERRFSFFLILILGSLASLSIFYGVYAPKGLRQISDEGWSLIQHEKIKAQKDFAEFIKSPAGKIWAKHPYWPPEICQKIAQGEIFQGMSKDQVKESLNKKSPAKIKIIVNNEREEWIVEGEGKMVFHFLNGVLHSWEGK